MGRLSCSGSSASAFFQNVNCSFSRLSGSFSSPSSFCCHSVKSAYCTGSGAQSGACPRSRALYAVDRSRDSGASDQPSLAMWCSSNRTTWSVGLLENTVTRSGTSAARSKLYRPASASSTGRVSASVATSVITGWACASGRISW